MIFSRNMCSCPDCQLLVGMCFVGWSMCCRPECWLLSTGMCALCGMGFVVSRYVYSWQKCELLSGLRIVYKNVSLLAGVCVDS